MKNVLITGATSGIGKACALYFASHGYHVAINGGHNEAALYELQDQLEEFPVETLSFLGDVGDYHFADTMIRQILATWGSIDCVVNNAAVSYIGLLTDMNPADWNNIITTNLSSVFNICHAAIPSMVSVKSGKIINISSVWGEVGASCEVAYSASKGGINAFTKALAKELAPSNIQVNAIAPGIINTPMNSHLSEEELSFIEEEIPAGRMGTPSEIAKMIYMLSNAPAYLTGQIIRMDGGWI